MSRTDLLRRAKHRLEQLSEQRLRTADDILSYLEDLDSDEATEELLRIPGLLDRIEKAEQDIAQDKTVSVEELRRKRWPSTRCGWPRRLRGPSSVLTPPPAQARTLLGHARSRTAPAP